MRYLKIAVFVGCLCAAAAGIVGAFETWELRKKIPEGGFASSDFVGEFVEAALSDNKSTDEKKFAEEFAKAIHLGKEAEARFREENKAYMLATSEYLALKVGEDRARAHWLRFWLLIDCWLLGILSLVSACVSCWSLRSFVKGQRLSKAA